MRLPFLTAVVALSFGLFGTVTQAEEAHQQWIQHLAGTWNVTNPDGTHVDEVLELTSGGRALLSKGKMANGVEYVRLVGWHADTETLVETWYLSDGMSLVNRFDDISEGKIVGKTMLATAEGKTGKGTVVREKVGENEMKFTFRGTMQGETNETKLEWISERE